MRLLTALLCTTAALVAVTSCTGDHTPAAPDIDVTAAKASGGGGTTTTLSVTAATPAIAPTDTIVDVTISGTGFAKGATARWSIAGDTTQVQVVSTSYVNSTTLRSRVSVPVGAKVGTYDIVVTVGGKKGVGAELFEVVLGDPKTDWYFPTGAAAPAVGLRSDGLFLQSGQSVYGNGVCGVSSKLFATSEASGSGDATLQTDNPNFKDRKCTAYPRTMSVVYSDGQVDRGTVFANLRALQNASISIPVGSTELRGLILNLGSATALRCAQIRWTDVIQNGTLPVPGDMLAVTRLSATSWLVKSRPYPDNRAYCLSNGAVYHLDVEFTIVSRSLPSM